MANGNFAGGDGTESNPYLIEDAFDLDAIRNDLSAHYALISDIDLNISPFNEGEGWIPVSDFEGVLNGNNKTVKRLTIISTLDYTGLFGQVSVNGKIKNIALEEVDVSGIGSVGSIAGFNNGEISNSYATGSVYGSGIRVGGLVGRNGGILKDSFSDVSVEGGYVGGLVGHNWSGSIFNCYSIGNVNHSNAGEYYGGLVGWNYRATIESSYWDVESSGVTATVRGIGLNTQEMQTAQTFIDAGWDENIWKLTDGKYPELDAFVKIIKTLILSDGEYKRYDEGSPAIVSENNAVPVMTSNTSPSGVASASSEYNSDYSAYKAFDDTVKTFTKLDNGWLSSENGSAWLAYEFDEEIAIGKYRIAPRWHDYALENAPKDWTFEGFDGVDWIVLDTVTDVTDWEELTFKEFEIDNKIAYKIYRINVQSNNNTSRSVAIGELELIRSIVPATPSSWQTVSTNLPTSQQFQEEGMEDLSILDRQVQPVLSNPLQMSKEALGEGNVFKGKIDLKKYFDLRKLEVK